MSQSIRVLSVFGQKLGFTGSGIVVLECFRWGERFGDKHFIVDIDYFGESQCDVPSTNRLSVLASQNGESADLDHPIPGMSDVMPYKTIRYSDLSAKQIERFLNTVRAKIQAAVEVFKPDVIHFHHLWLLSTLAQYFSCPSVVTIHGTDLKLLKTLPSARRLISEGDASICRYVSVSKKCGDIAQLEYGISAMKISVRGNGYNSELFNMNSSVPHERDSKLILFAGKFAQWKGVKYLIKACSHVRKDFRLVIAGNGTLEERQILENEVRINGLTERVDFTGHLTQERLAWLMKKAKVFVLPSIDEPFGLVILEAMASGCPVVCADEGGPKEFVPKNLVDRGLIDLIPPLRDIGEQGYVEVMSKSIAGKLTNSLTLLDQITIRKSIEHLTWGNYYKNLRNDYEECGRSADKMDYYR